MTPEELATTAAVRADYEQHLGKLIWVHVIHLDGWREVRGCQPPLLMRIVPGYGLRSVSFGWSKPGLIPYWDVEPARPYPILEQHPDWCQWVLGPTRYLDGQVEPPDEWELADQALEG